MMRQIRLTEARPGMALARTVINDHLIVVLTEGTALTAAHITRLGHIGVENIYVKDESEPAPPLMHRAAAFAAEYQEIVAKVESMFARIAATREAPVEEFQSLIDDAVAPMVRQTGVIDYLYEIKSMDASTYNHSLRVSILTGVLGKWLGYAEPAVQEVILAGFLHDIGKTQFPPELQGRVVDQLDARQRKYYEKHPAIGHSILEKKRDGLPEGVRLAVLQHHEQMDGTGYPFGIDREKIHEYARVVAVADLYDNITTEREGFMKQTPFSAAAAIGRGMYSTLDPRVCVTFLSQLRQSLTGSTVLLSDQTEGRIIQYPFELEGLPILRLTDNDIIDLNKRPDLKIIEYSP